MWYFITNFLEVLHKMANGRKRITNTSSPNTEKKRQRLDAKFSEYKHPEFDSQFC